MAGHIYKALLCVVALLSISKNVFKCDETSNDLAVAREEEDTSAKGITPELISTDPNHVQFFLYPDNKNKNYKEQIYGDVDSLLQSQFNTSLPVKILIHGFMSNSTDTNGFIDFVKNAYLAVNTAANIITVDWGYLSTVKDRLPLLQFYHTAVQNVQIVGKHVAEFLVFLLENKFVADTSQIHLVGFSLGAHVSGVAGYAVLQNTSVPIHRITGLDPAGPAFKNVKGRDFKLDSTDASFVDVTHTNQGENGYRGEMGHADFYPNGGGPKQPQCLNITEPIKSAAGMCAHGFAYRLFAESIKTSNIRACKCDSSILLDVPCTSLNATTCEPSVIYGENCPQSARGRFYFKYE